MSDTLEAQEKTTNQNDEALRRAAEDLAAEEAAAEAQSRDSLSQSRFASAFRSIWQDVDPSTVEFNSFISHVSTIEQVQGVTFPCQKIVMASGNEIHWLRQQVDERTVREFIGLTNKQGEMTPSCADDIIEAARARGWKSIIPHGSPEECDMLWLAAMKQGMPVKNFHPSPETRAAWEAMQQGVVTTAGLTSGDDEAPDASADNTAGPDGPHGGGDSPDNTGPGTAIAIPQSTIAKRTTPAGPASSFVPSDDDRANAIDITPTEPAAPRQTSAQPKLPPPA